MDYDLIFREQAKALAAEFAEDMAMCLIATSHERLVRHARDFGWRLGEVVSVRPTHAVTVTKPGRPAELWVRRTYRAYRRAYERFLAQHSGGDGGRLPVQWDVDHLQSLHRFMPEHPLYFVRLALVPRSTNASYGAGFEKLFYSAERHTPPSGGMHMDWLAFLKSQGIRLPGKRAGLEAWQLWAWDVAGRMAETLQENRVLCFGGISTMLNLGYASRYAPLPFHHSFAEAAMSDPAHRCFGAWHAD